MNEVHSLLKGDTLYYVDDSGNNQTEVCVGEKQLCEFYGVKKIGEIPVGSRYEATDFSWEHGYINKRNFHRVKFSQVVPESTEYYHICRLDNDTSYLPYLKGKVEAVKGTKK